MAHSTVRKLETPTLERREENWHICHRVKTVLPIERRGAEVLLDAHAYQAQEPETQAVALVHKRDAFSDAIPVVRVHSGCVTGDIFHSLRCDCYAQLQTALDRIASEAFGVLIYLPYQEGRGIGLFRKIKAYALQDLGHDTVDANVAQGEPVDGRHYGFASEILRDLEINRVRLMTNNPRKVAALNAAGIRVVERIPIAIGANQHNKAYLDTKRSRLLHDL